MQLFLEGKNLILFVMVRCCFNARFFNCSMYFQGTWNPSALPILLNISMRNIGGAIQKSTFRASCWPKGNIVGQDKGRIWDPTSFWKWLSGSKAQKPLQKLPHSDQSKRITWWPTKSACLGNGTLFNFYILPQGFFLLLLYSKINL